MANAYGQEIGKIVTYFTSLFGLPPYANLTIVETEDGAPNGYAAPGLIFLNPRGIGKGSERQAAGEPDLAAVVGRAGFSGQPQSSVAEQRPGELLGDALHGAGERSVCARERRCAIRPSKR